MSKSKILVCLDTDAQPSVFDGVVAVDSGVNHLFRHAEVEPLGVQELVHGAMFTRGPSDLKDTAIFIGGSDVTAGDELLAAVKECFFGPMRVSVMLDSNGSNTTAAAAVIAAGRHVDLSQSTVAVLAGTGNVGKRVMLMLADEGARIRLGSRSVEHAQEVAAGIQRVTANAEIECIESVREEGLRETLEGANVVIACGPPGIPLLPQAVRDEFADLAVAIDLNAVPPLGIEGIEMVDKAEQQAATLCYGAIGVGGTKMKIHRAAIAKLFSANDLVLDAREIYELGKELDGMRNK